MPRPVVVLLLAAATLFALEAGARGTLYVLSHWRTDPRSGADAYAGADWVERYYREFRESSQLTWTPYVYWRARPYRGAFINISEQGLRRTWSSPGTPGPRPRVFVFGGSTVWGTGARDEFTAPSHLARALAAAGRHVDVVNFGQTGYVTRQSLIALAAELRAGRVPDVAVFQSGVEDTFSALQNGEAGLPQNETNRRVEFNAAQPERIAQQWTYLSAGLTQLASELRRVFVLERAAGATGDAPSAALADAVIANYCEDVRQIEALAREYGFRALFFWQPVLFEKQQPTAYERSADRGYQSARPFFAAVYGRMRRHAACGTTPVADLSPAIAAETAPMFVDAFHLTEEGNRRIAETVAAAVARALLRLEDASVQ